jgi:hypothetical protein
MTKNRRVMDVRVTWSFNLILTKEEFVLVSKALRGALVKEDEKALAIQLQEKMVEQKHSILEQALGESAKTIANIQAKYGTAKEGCGT